MAISVSVNNQKHSLGTTQNLSLLLKELKIDSPKGIAVAVNNEVIPKSEWENFIINENDKIILIKATAGG